ncbi:MAG: FadR family transcriptional regulator [Caulobacteraceae bacterium]|nr:FadR family transcriptional regulator [Caulobacteraceae bacterium]
MTPASTATDEVVRVRKLGEKIAERILAEITELGWPVGQNLGTERELLEKYGIARATFREAVRQVERHGAAVMRRGAGGGLVVREPPRSATIRAMMTFFELTRVNFADQHETREQLEVMAAHLAANRADEEAIARLRAVVGDLEETTEIVDNIARNMEARVAVAVAADNPALSLFIEALNGVQRESLRVLRMDEEEYKRDSRLSFEFKHKLVEAIADGKADRAERLVREDMRRRLLAMTSAIARSTAAPGPINYAERLPAWWEAGGGPVKLADQIVARMVADISKLGWKEGVNLGREADLQPRYGVSRAVLREAIRQLELHGIAHMKTGLPGGLVIGRADPRYTVELVTTYLLSTAMTVRQLLEIQSALEVFAVGRLAQIATADDRLALIEAMTALRRADAASALDRARTLHRQIADRTGNRALSLFIRVLIQCGMQLYPPPCERDLSYLVAAHEQILEAIFRHDIQAAETLTRKLFARGNAWMIAQTSMEKLSDRIPASARPASAADTPLS